MEKTKAISHTVTPDVEMMREILDNLSRARAKVWEAQREQADTVYEATKFIFERGWFEVLKIDESKLRRMVRR